MKKRLYCFILAFMMLLPLAQPAHAATQPATPFEVNGVTVRYTDFYSSPHECWVYASDMYKKIWKTYFDNTFHQSSNSLRNLRDDELTLTLEHLRDYVSNAALGSCLRICDRQYLHSGDGWGHSQIIVQKDENGFTVLEGGLSLYPYCREYYYTWEEYINTDWLGYEYIKYIKWPGAPEYDRCKHTYTDMGVCTLCEKVYDLEGAFVSEEAGKYRLTQEVIPVTERPYATAPQADLSLPADTVVEVLGRYTNAQKEKWVQISYKGNIYYAPAQSMEFVDHLDQQVICDITTPAENQIIHRGSYPVEGAITSRYPLQEIQACIDGKVYATLKTGKVKSIKIEDTQINYGLSFGSLSPGRHTIEIRARDIHREELTTVCTRVFFTKGLTRCEHQFEKGVCYHCGSTDLPAGDMDGNGIIDSADVEYLLCNILYPQDYPLLGQADFTGDGSVTTEDVEYLLCHILYPEDYPIE